MKQRDQLRSINNSEQTKCSDENLMTKTLRLTEEETESFKTNDSAKVSVD